MQDNNKEFWKGVLDGFVKTYIAAICAFIVFLLVCFICGCSKTHYVPVETVRTEYVDKVKVERVTDSVTNDRFVYVKGDTVYIREWRDRWHTNEVHDTIVSVKTDSVSVPYPVERKLTKWQQAKMDFGEVALGVMGAVIVGLVIWLVIVKRKR